MRKYIVLSLILIVSFMSCVKKPSKTLLFVGSFTEGAPSDGIHVYEFDDATGELFFRTKVDSLINPSFLKIAIDGKHLYSVMESQLPTHGKVAAFAVDSITGSLKLLNVQGAGGRNPAHLSLHPNGKYLVNSNYTDAGISFFQIETDGSLAPYHQLVEFKDSSIVKGRQDEAHLHSTNFSPDGDFLFGQDLGADKIRRFTITFSESQKMNVNEVASVSVAPGSGPRHFTFHPNAKFGYGVSELSGKVAAYAYDNGHLEFLADYQSYATKQEIYRAADIHISPYGKFLYASNRGPKEDSISIFLINQETGSLNAVGYVPTYGKHPRNFVISPSGKFLLVANQFSDNIVVFERNSVTGELTKQATELPFNNPSSLQMHTYKRY
jgi:6-phosphogluconolactonase (cycloisomerase 2 family)